MALTEVILREKIDNLGAEADVVKVKAGFARNFLIPAGKAYEATKGNLRQIENLQVARAKRETEELNEAQELASKISRMKPKFTLDVGKNGKAFGSVTTIDIHKALEDKGISIDRTAIQLDKPIKSTGKSDVEVKLHADVTTSLTITVEATEAAAAE
ncbi:50S ribosomal protein L9 [Akkermansiaceae bacterium]|jgi:large subunit ribosomal protein L9|nr:50S ribosomal protein L9 [Akkermansiaceae bacterium]MDA7907508.1 50S ribosomal protein L9 [Akkermansiaceae bacterium]MDA7929443.1 50S ribosomal protein L9 [Akkermansiaceae bacterium]MDA9830054.1 50S ribosomal protein L9 [Akkermansiaceae bacterium]MDB4465654.1 50S ribosomal protein L9 [Akkermansiaceae bacterium]